METFLIDGIIIIISNVLSFLKKKEKGKERKRKIFYKAFRPKKWGLHPR